MAAPAAPPAPGPIPGVGLNARMNQGNIPVGQQNVAIIQQYVRARQLPGGIKQPPGGVGQINAARLTPAQARAMNAVQAQPGVQPGLTPQQQQRLLRQRQLQLSQQNSRRRELITRVGRVGAVAAARRSGERLGSLPQPGGIPLMLVILAFFLLIIVPVNGPYTRLGVLWLALLGRAKVPQPDSPPSADAAIGSLVGDAFRGAGVVGSAAAGAVGTAIQGAQTPAGNVATNVAIPGIGPIILGVENIASGLGGFRLPGNLGGAFGQQ